MSGIIAVETCDVLGLMSGFLTGDCRLIVEVGLPSYPHGDVYGEFRQSTTTNLLFYWTWTRAKFERGTTERVLMVKPSGEVFRTGRIFSQPSLTLRSWKI